MEKKNILYCNNCGNEGHLYRYCRLPVLSYGVLCINDEKVIMIQRKDSLSYIEFLRGKYDINDSEYLIKLFNGCSIKERDKIKINSFDKLWDDLWITLESKKQNERMIKEYVNSKDKFEKIKNLNLNELLDKCDTNYETPEWEFPKGRRNNRETNIKCAVREFEEETDLTKNDYILLDNVVPISEEYLGSNGVRYKHIYYIAFYKGDGDLKINKDKYEQYTEISDIAWLSFDECFKILRKEQTTKYDIINKIRQINNLWMNDFDLKQ
jgi:ADP-ribose pyrophosphatase YjhB (NUDIX family)